MALARSASSVVRALKPSSLSVEKARAALPSSSRYSSSYCSQSFPRKLASATSRAPRFPSSPSSSRVIVRNYSSSSRPLQDPEHPHGLYFHPQSSSSSSSTRYAVSFLSSSPPAPDHPSVLASISVPSSDANDPASFARQHPDEVVANKAFWDVLHKTLKEDVVGKGLDAILTQEADLREAGWAHLNDQRQLLMPGRIPTPDAIIASVSFIDCKIAPETYTINDTHRPITREEGWTVLRDEWLKALKKRLQ